MKTILAGLLVILVLLAPDVRAETNVLLIASTKRFEAVKGLPDYTEQDLLRLVRSRLASELAIRDKINVVFEEVYREKKMDVAVGGGGQMQSNAFACHSLAQWYFWPEGREERLATLSGKGKTRFDYVILVGDPYLLINMPGVYAEGVNLIASEVGQGPARTILLTPWGDRSTREIKVMNEVVCRVANGSGLTMIPKAVAAKAAKDAEGVFESVNPFTMKYVDKRKITYHHTGTSSERGIEAGLRRAADACNVDISKSQPTPGVKIDFNYGRANTGFEPDKRYKVQPEQYDRSYGFPMQDHSNTAAESMRFGIDRRRDDGTDLGIALHMIKQNEVGPDVRCVPIRLMWAKMQDLDPTMMPLRDRWHMSNHLDAATGAFMYTLLSGRCPIADNPADGNPDGVRNWLGQKVGYETAWRMNHLGARVPGFQVRPTDKTADLKPGASSELRVKFHYPPNSDVTVTIAVDKPSAATISPATLTFTPDNHHTAQTVTVTGADVQSDTPFRVSLKTASDDAAYTALSDTWTYTALKR